MNLAQSVANASAAMREAAAEIAALRAERDELREALQQTCMALRVAPINWTKNQIVVDALSQADKALSALNRKGDHA